MDLNRYRAARYIDGGRGPIEFDCWGWVRQVLHDECNTPLFASYGNVHPEDKVDMTRHGKKLVKHFIETETPAHGVVTALFYAGLMTHVGIFLRIDGRLRVSHITREGLRQDTIKNFARVGSGDTVKLYKAKTDA